MSVEFRHEWTDGRIEIANSIFDKVARIFRLSQDDLEDARGIYWRGLIRNNKVDWIAEPKAFLNIVARSAIKSQFAHKNTKKNSIPVLSFNDIDPENDDLDYSELFDDPDSLSPFNAIINDVRESEEYLSIASKLTTLEREVLDEFLDTPKADYQQLAEATGYSAKQVDNAFLRIRAKATKRRVGTTISESRARQEEILALKEKRFSHRYIADLVGTTIGNVDFVIYSAKSKSAGAKEPNV